MSANAPEMPKGRLRQMFQAYRITKKTDRSLPYRLLAWFLVVGGVSAMLQMVLFGRSWIAISGAAVFGLLSGLLAVLIVLGRRAEHAEPGHCEFRRGEGKDACHLAWQPDSGRTKGLDSAIAGWSSRCCRQDADVQQGDCFRTSH